MKLTVHFPTCVHIWKVNAKCRRIAEPIAAEFGMTVEQFLTRWSQNRLPGQLERPSPDVESGVEPPAEFKIRCTDSKLRAKIQRAAGACGETFESFIFYAVMDSVRCSEDDMILSPTTGRVIGDEADLWDFGESVTKP